MDNILQQGLRDLFKEFEESKKANQRFSELNALLQEELKLSRNAEKSAESKKARCEAFLSQQQEIINGLLAVKEENENLKCKLKQIETSLAMVQNNNIMEQMRSDAKIQDTERNYSEKIIKLQEESDYKVEKVRSEYLDTINDLKKTISQLEQHLTEKNAEIVSMQEKIENLKALSDANMEAFHQKLAEQERKHQCELETWKMAEMNRLHYERNMQNNQVNLYNSIQTQHQSTQILSIQGYQPTVRYQGPIIHQKTPLVTHLKNTQRQNTNMVRPLAPSKNYKSKSDFISANDLYTQSHTSIGSMEQSDDNDLESEKINQSHVTPKPQIDIPKKRKLFSSHQNIL